MVMLDIMVLFRGFVDMSSGLSESREVLSSYTGDTSQSSIPIAQSGEQIPVTGNLLLYSASLERECGHRSSNRSFSDWTCSRNVVQTHCITYETLRYKLRCGGPSSNPLLLPLLSYSITYHHSACRAKQPQ